MNSNNRHVLTASTSSALPMVNVMGAYALVGTFLYNHRQEKLGKIKEVMIDARTGIVGYVVLSTGGLFGIGEKLLAVPWPALTLDGEQQLISLKVDKDHLKNAPGFAKDYWPNMAEPFWTRQINAYYGIKT